MPELYEVRILADSIGPSGVRLVTWQWTFPRPILPEVNTHQMVVRSSASSRAIPAKRLSAQIKDNPYMPALEHNKPGMQSSEPLEGSAKAVAEGLIENHRNAAIFLVDALTNPARGLNVHKQFANRYLEPWMHCTQICTATDLANMLALRTDKAAQPDFRKVAENLYTALEESTPQQVKHGEWHLPMMDQHREETEERLIALADGNELMAYLRAEDEKRGTDYARHYTEERHVKYARQDISCARIARVSYEHHESGKIDILADIRLACQLTYSNPGHWSPLAHIAVPAEPKDMVYRLDQLARVGMPGYKICPKPNQHGYCAHFREWKQYRKFYPDENIREFRGIRD